MFGFKTIWVFVVVSSQCLWKNHQFIFFSMGSCISGTQYTKWIFWRSSELRLSWYTVSSLYDVVSNDVVGRIRNSGVHIFRIGIKDISLYLQKCSIRWWTCKSFLMSNAFLHTDYNKYEWERMFYDQFSNNIVTCMLCVTNFVLYQYKTSVRLKYCVYFEKKLIEKRICTSSAA